jgi:hypothetical protein
MELFGCIVHPNLMDGMDASSTNIDRERDDKKVDRANAKTMDEDYDTRSDPDLADEPRASRWSAGQIRLVKFGNGQRKPKQFDT